MTWITVILFSVFILLIWLIDEWRLEAGYRVEPAPHSGVNEPTSIQEDVAHHADKQAPKKQSEVV